MAGQKLPLIDETGYCHGLALAWLKKMAERKEQWFYDIQRAMINATDEKLKEFNSDFEKFIAKIEYPQYSAKHTKQLFDLSIETVTQNDIDIILEARAQINKDNLYSKCAAKVATERIT